MTRLTLGLTLAFLMGLSTGCTGTTDEPPGETDPTDASDTTDPADASDPTDPVDESDAADPTDASDPTDPIDESDATDPTDASDPTDPVDESDAADPTDASDPTDPVDESDATDPTDASDPTDPVDETDAADPTEPDLSQNLGLTIDDDVVALTCSGDVCTADALDLGIVPISATSSITVRLHNLSSCVTEPEAADACDACTISMAPNAAHHNQGVGFAAGSNDDGLFALGEDTLSTFTLAQADAACDNSGWVDVSVDFNAPQDELTANTTLVIESDAVNAPIIEIPIAVESSHKPVAIAELRVCETTDGSGNPIMTDCTYPDSIEPLYRAYFDASQSYDPLGGTLAQYSWEVIEAPQGVNPDDYDWAGQSSTVSSFWVPIAGLYVVRLTVWNDSGVQSAVTHQSDVEFWAVPSSMVHIQLVWDHPSNDQDLHLTHASEGGNFCSSTRDCFFSNRHPQWFTSHPAGGGPNPRLDKDDTNGLGPENINIDQPNAGTYRVFAHYYPWSSAGDPVVNTVRIYLQGMLQFDASRTMTDEEQVWAVADIIWSGSSGEVEAYPSDAPNQVGALAYRDSAACYTSEGWVFPD